MDPNILLQGQGVAAPNPMSGLKDMATIANLIGESNLRSLQGQKASNDIQDKQLLEKYGQHAYMNTEDPNYLQNIA